MEDLPLLELFTRLREAGLPLGVGEYQLVLQSIQAGFSIKDRESLKRLCRTLWVKSAGDEERIFDYHFERLIGSAVLANNASEDLPNADNRKRFLLKVAATISGVSIIGVVIYLFYSKNQPTETTPTPSSSATSTVTPTKTSPSPSASPTTEATPVAIVTQNYPTNLPLYISIGGIVFVIAIIVGIVWVARRRRQLQTQANSMVKVTTIASTAALSPKLIQELRDEVRVAQVVRRTTGAKDRGFGDRSMTNLEFFPVTRRQMKQSWRYLRRLVREGAPTELDVEATVDRIGREGMLLEPVLVPRRVNRTELLLLIDQDGSMAPFHSLSQRLIETAVQGSHLSGAGIYYFHNCPTEYLYHDPMHQEAVPIEEILAQLNKSRTAVLIFSDAGAARGGFNPRRRRLTKKFLNHLKQHVRYISWLNPMPQSRWPSTTAAEIAHLVPMFEISRQGLDSAIEVLRGRYSHPREGT